MVGVDMIGHRLPDVRAKVEAGRLRSFRQTIGAADAADPVAPLTYLFSLALLEAERPLAFIEDLGVDIGSVLHSEQSFTYHAPVRVDDELRIETVVSDVFEKKGGALIFVVQDSTIGSADGRHVADVRRTLVIRN